MSGVQIMPAKGMCICDCKTTGFANSWGCSVPEMIEFDDHLWAIDMSIVDRPFVFDFAGAFLDQAPDFPDEVMADWHAEKKEQFGS